MPESCSARWMLGVILLLAAIASTFTTASAHAQSQDQKDRERIRELREQRKELARSKADTYAQIDALNADDQTLLDALTSLDEQTEELLAQVSRSEERIVSARAAESDARRSALQLKEEIEQVKTELRERAIDVFVQPPAHAVDQLSTDSLGRSSVKFYLLDQVIGNELDIANELRVVQDRLVAEQRRALDQGRAASEMLQSRFALLADLDKFRTQAGLLRGEYQRRIQEWKSEAAGIDRTDLDIAREIVSIEAGIKERELARQRLAAEARRRAAEEARRRAEAREGPFQLILWPARGPITSGFGLRRHPIFGITRAHNGIDIGGNTGDRVSASRSGQVVIAGWRGGYGNTVAISHGLGYTTLYAHLSVISVSVGQSVTSGDRIGSLGSTGWSTGPHLHFELRIDGRAVNPIPYLPR